VALEAKEPKAKVWCKRELQEDGLRKERERKREREKERKRSDVREENADRDKVLR
jgi:hypothetical protein